MTSTASELVEDYLEVDKPIPGQNYVCLSFVSPDKILPKKDEFTFYKYSQDRTNTLMELISKQFEDILTKAVDNTVDIAQVVRVKKFIDTQLKTDKVTFDEFHDKYEDFMFRDGKAIQSEFDEANNFQTNVRGIKVRGVYDTYKEADMRAKVLQRMDQSFHVYVGQVGYWLPWDPNANDIENQEYLNGDLNRLVKEYKENEVKKDIFYHEQKRERKKEAMSVAERLRKKLDDKKSAAAAATSIPPSTLANNDEDIASQLQTEDPWMQRKAAAAAAAATTEDK